MKKAKKSRKILAFSLVLAMVMQMLVNMVLPPSQTPTVQAAVTPSNWETKYERLPGLAQSSIFSSKFTKFPTSRSEVTIGEDGIILAGNGSAAYWNETLDLKNKNYQLDFDIDTRQLAGGMTFSFFKPTGSITTMVVPGGAEKNNMATYAEGTKGALPNSVSVEIDPAYTGFEDKWVEAGSKTMWAGSQHTAITFPINTYTDMDRLTPTTWGLAHYGHSDVSVVKGWEMFKTASKRIRIWWETPTQSGSSNYKISYDYFNEMSGGWLGGDYWQRRKGEQVISPAQLDSLLAGGQNMYFGIFTGGPVRVKRSENFVYTVAAYQMTQDGQKTDNLVPDLANKQLSGRMPSGVYDFNLDGFGQDNVPGWKLQTLSSPTTADGYVRYGSNGNYYPQSYRLLYQDGTAANDSTNVKFYYKAVTTTPWKTDYYLETSDGKFAKAFTYSGTGTTGTTATAPDFYTAVIQNNATLDATTKSNYKDGYVKVASAVDSQGATVTSVDSKPIAGDGSTTLPVYLKLKDGVPYTVQFRNNETGAIIAPDYKGKGTFKKSVPLTSAIDAVGTGTTDLTKKAITGFNQVAPSAPFQVNSLTANSFIIYYNPQPDVAYTVNYYFRKFDDNINDVDGYFTDGKTYNTKVYGSTPDATVTGKGAADDLVTAPALTSDKMPVLYDGSIKADPAAFYSKAYPSGTIAADGSLVLNVYYEAKRYPFYVSRYLQKPNTNADDIANYTVAKAYMPGTRGWGTKRVLFDEPYNGFTFYTGFANNVMSGRIIPATEIDPANPAALAAFTGLSLKGYYKANTDISYTVEYFSNADNSTLAPLKTVTGKTMGETVTETAPVISGYTATKATESLVLNNTGNIMKFMYTPNTNTTVQVIYKAGEQVLYTTTTTATTAQSVIGLDVLSTTPPANAITGLSAADKTALLKTLNDGGYTYNATASSDAKIVAGDGSTVLYVGYTSPDGAPYKEQYFFAKADGTYSATPSRETTQRATAGTSVDLTANIRPFVGYTFDNGNASNVLQATVDVAGTTVLKFYYKANTDTKYEEDYLVEDPSGTVTHAGKTYSLIKSLSLTGVTGTTLKYVNDTTPSGGSTLITGYDYKGFAAIKAGDTITPEGDQRILLLYTRQAVNYTFGHYREIRQDIFPNIGDGATLPQTTYANPSVKTIAGQFGVTPNELMINDPAHPDFSTVGRNFVGFQLFRDDTLAVKPLVLDAASNNFGYKYKAIVSRPYTVKVSVKDSKGVVVTRDDLTTDHADGITGATFQVMRHLPAVPGYKFDIAAADTNITFDGTPTLPQNYADMGYKPYEPALRSLTSKILLYPYVPANTTGVAVRLLYTPVNVNYEVQHFLPKQDGAYDTTPSDKQTMQGLTSSTVTATLFTGDTNPKYAGYEANTGAPGYLASADVAGDGKTVLKIYYKGATSTNYQIGAVFADGGTADAPTYPADPSRTVAQTGTTGTVPSDITTPLAAYTKGYTYDKTKSDAANAGKVISGDGNTIFLAYFKPGADTEYKVRTYVMTTAGTYPSDAEATVETKKGATGQVAFETANPPTGFTYDANKSNNTVTIAGDGSSVINMYYARSRAELTVRYRRTMDGTTSDGTVIASQFLTEGYYGASVPIDGTTLFEGTQLVKPIEHYIYVKLADTFTLNNAKNEVILLYKPDADLSDALAKVKAAAIDPTPENIQVARDAVAKIATSAEAPGMTTVLDAAVKVADYRKVSTPENKKLAEDEIAKIVAPGEAVNKSNLSDALLKALSKSVLETAIKNANDKIAQGGWTPATLKALQDEIKLGQDMLTNLGTSTTEQMNAKAADIDAKAALLQKSADKTALDTAIGNGDALNIPADTTDPEDKAVVDALNAAKAVKANPEATQAEVDAATKALNDAIAAKLKADATEAVVKAEADPSKTNIDNAQAAIDKMADGPDKTALQDRLNKVKADTAKAAAKAKLEKAIADAEAKLAQGGWTPATKAALDKVVADGKALLADLATSTTDQMNTKADEIDAKAALLQKSADKTALDTAIGKGDALNIPAATTDPEDKAVVDALNAAKAVKANPEATQAEVDAATKALNDAIAAKLKADATEAVVKAEADPSKTNIDNAQAAIDKMADGPDKTALQDRLNKVKADTAKAAAKAKLEKAIADAETKLAQGGWTPATKAALDKAVAEGKALLADLATSTTEQMNTKADEIDAKAALLQKSADKTALDTAIGKGDALNIPAATTDPEDKAVVDALNAAKAVKANPEATQAEVDAATKALNDAIAAKLKADATEAVVKAEADPSKTNIDNAQAAIDKMAEGSDKTALQDRLNKVKADTAKAAAKAKLEKAIADAETKLAQGGWTPATKAALDKVVAEGKALLADLATSTTEQMNTKADEIDAKAALLRKSADTTELDKAIVKGTDLKIPTDTTDPEDKAVVDALKDANAVKANPEATQAEVDAATKKLNDAIDAKLIADAKDAVAKATTDPTKDNIDKAQDAIDKMPAGPDKTKLQGDLDAVKAKKALADARGELQAAIDVAKTKIALGGWTPATVKALQDEIAAGEAILADAAATIDTVKAKTVDVKAKTDSLMKQADRTDLNTLIKEAEDMKIPADTTKPLDKAVLDALKDAKIVAANGDATATEIQQAAEKLKTALEAKKAQDAAIKAAKDALRLEITNAEAKLAQGNWTPASKAELDAKIAEGNTLLAADDATVAQLDAKRLEVEAKKNALVKQADKVDLVRTIGKAKDLKVDPASTDPLDVEVRDALAAAEAVNGDLNATQAAVDAANDRLKKAVEAKLLKLAKDAVDKAKQDPTQGNIDNGQIAIDKLAPGPDKTKLQNELDVVKKQQNDAARAALDKAIKDAEAKLAEGGWTETTKTALETVIGKGKAALADNATTTVVLKDLTEQVIQKTTELKKQTDKSKLVDAIKIGEDLGIPSNPTTDIDKGVVKAIEDAKIVRDNPNATQAEIDEAEKKLRNAIEDKLIEIAIDKIDKARKDLNENNLKDAEDAVNKLMPGIARDLFLDQIAALRAKLNGGSTPATGEAVPVMAGTLALLLLAFVAAVIKRKHEHEAN